MLTAQASTTSLLLTDESNGHEGGNWPYMLFDHTNPNQPSPAHAVDGGPVPPQLANGAPVMAMHDMIGHFGNSNPRHQVWHTPPALNSRFLHARFVMGLTVLAR